MAKWSPVVRIELQAHAHATEDVERVAEAMLNLLPEELRGRVEVEAEELEGHHGNPIVRLRIRLEGVEAEETLRYIASRLDEADKTLLEGLVGERYDEDAGVLYLRFSKQDAYMGKLRLWEGDDVVRLVIVLRGTPRLERVRGILRSLGLIGGGSSS